MTSQALAATRPAGRIERYRHAERAVWDHYGLQPKERFVEVDQPAARIRVVEVGSGPPLLVVHGTFGSGPAFAALAREMPNRRLLLMDRPGFGLSSPIAYRADGLGTAIADLQQSVLDGLGLDRVDVVGHSIGAVFALRLALRHPERVGRVVLLGAGPIVQEAGVPPVIRRIASPLGAIMVRLTRRRGVTLSMIRGSGHAPAMADGRIPDVLVDWRVAVNRDTDSMWHERAMVRAIVQGGRYRPELTFADSELSEIAQPTLMLYGTADSVGSPAIWRRVIDSLPNGQLIILDGAGHMVWLDDPAGVARRTESFLSD
jgi:2-hydroxy-6-oxonona-2,4-dienedioate hydrolase/4,5:9,10-diseco-3-hydroxy-5,9,17-trioxoandrosta-1(10),2-diene-4-oate hydrolase